MKYDNIPISYINSQDIRLLLESKQDKLINWDPYTPKWSGENLSALYDSSSQKYYVLEKNGTYLCINQNQYDSKDDFIPIAKRNKKDELFQLNLYTPLSPNNEPFTLKQQTTSKPLLNDDKKELEPSPDLIKKMMNASRQIVINHEAPDPDHVDKDYQRALISINDKFKDIESTEDIKFSDAITEFINANQMDTAFIDLLQKPNFQAQTFASTFSAYHAKKPKSL